MALAAFVGSAAVAGHWAGPANADFGTYLHQALSHDWLDRPTHLAFVALLAPIARWPIPWPLASAAAVALLAVRNGASPVARAASLAAVASLAPFPEVDPAWLLAATAGPAGAGLAVALSPAAVLALPAIRARRWGWIAAGVAVLALSVGTAGGWWVGERGVLRAPPWMPGKVAGAWLLALPWALLPAVRFDRALLRDLALSAPLLLLPPDVPGWAIPALRLARSVRADGRRWVAIQAVASGLGAVALLLRVHGENVTVREVADRLGPDDGVEAPFSWGARVAIAATGDPYGVRWHPPGRFLRDQERVWCADPPQRVWVLPPEAGRVEVRADGGAACR